MQITTPHYEGFANSNYLEELLLQLGMKIADIQKDSSINTEQNTIISVNSNIDTETTNITCNGWIGTWNNGIFAVKNFFPAFDFSAGVGVYPFNRANICDAFFHIAMWQQKQEISTARNPGKVNFIDWGITSQSTIGASMQADISLNVTDLPILVTVQSDQTIIKAKPYLS